MSRFIHGNRGPAVARKVTGLLKAVRTRQAAADLQISDQTIHNWRKQ
jgi:hypothetical protein